MLADFQLIHYRERNTSINADALFSFLREQGIPDEIMNYAQQQVMILDILLYTPLWYFTDFWSVYLLPFSDPTQAKPPDTLPTPNYYNNRGGGRGFDWGLVYKGFGSEQWIHGFFLYSGPGFAVQQISGPSFFEFLGRLQPLF